MEIPHDVWLHVAQFLPPYILRTLLTVNRTFFEIAMDERYRRVVFDGTSKHITKTVNRLRDPNVARRVRALRILLSPSLTSSPRKITSWLFLTALPPSLSRKAETFSNAIRNFKAKISPSRWPLDNLPKGKLGGLRLSLDQAIDAIACLSGVVEYVVESDPRAPRNPIPAFLSVAASTFGSNLVKLSLVASLGKLQLCAAISPLPHFSNLEELHVTFRTQTPNPTTSNESIGMMEVAAFVNNFAPTIGILSFDVWRFNRDLSPFFCGLGQFPRLKQFVLIYFSNSRRMLATSTLRNILRNHRHSLQYLTLASVRTYQLEQGCNPLCEEWLDTGFSGVYLRNLQTLHLSLCCPTQPTASIVRNSADSLTSLRLGGWRHTFSEIQTVVDALSHLGKDSGLKMLGIDVVWLSPQLLDLFATTFPSLQVLHLAIQGVSKDDTSGYSTPEEFYQEMSRRSYVDWKLADIWISLGYRSDHNGDWELMEKLAEYIPSIAFFGGAKGLGIDKQTPSGSLVFSIL